MLEILPRGESAPLQIKKIFKNGKLIGVLEKVDGYTDYYTAEEYERLEAESEQLAPRQEGAALDKFRWALDEVRATGDLTALCLLTQEQAATE